MAKDNQDIVEEISDLQEDNGLTDETQLQAIEDALPKVLSIMPLSTRPVFPGLALPLTFTGEDSLKRIKQIVEKENGFMGVVLRKNSEDEEDEDAGETDLYEIGTVFKVLRVVPMAPGTVQILGQGVNRFRKERSVLVKPSMRWEVKHLLEPKEKITSDLKAYMMAVSSEIKTLLKLNPLFKEQVNLVVSQLNYDAPGLTMDVISNLLSAEGDVLQELLETIDLQDRAKMLIRLIREELEMAKIQKKIQDQIEDSVSDQQKEFFLRKQLDAIKKELGIEKDDKDTEVEKIEKKLADKKLPKEVMKTVHDELNKLKTLNVQSPEFNVTRSYLETIADLPWGLFSDDNHDIKRAREILDEGHYGLKDVKELILEFLSAVIKRGKIAGSIICLVGPPGVGKTSIGKSVAEALNRQFFRFSVGGMRDEAEIKGHRRTYIGAMPGKLIQSLKRVGTSNPVIMLDEIDKIGTSFRGDPASALLEVLDPEQNATFLDHYLDVPYDLSNVLFITTANQLDTIPAPLLDRMEVIRLSGYILEEKVEIARQYLIPKQLREHGFEPGEIEFTEDALMLIVEKYAREAGVRNLEKQIRKIIRKVTLKLAESGEMDKEITKEDVSELLGKVIYRTEKLYDRSHPGVVLGLAYTSLGGATLYIESSAVKSKSGGFKRTGQLGSVMQESSEIAYSYIRSLLSEDKAATEFFDTYKIHMHVPAGATPKDGPSAGITMALSLYSLAKDKPVKDNLAMTGELTLTGKVLPIGGVKEKTIAARRVGISELIFPEANQRDFEELPDYIKEGLTIHFADYFEDVLKVAYKD
ncbi:MAG: endopeptidase La [Bacteroidetes bacterium]|nr:endopeptidase La [Bacteroidota bacterium]